MFAFQKTVEGGGETPGSEVFFMKSNNLLSVSNVDDATWETLPRGDVGLQWDSRLKLGEEPHIIELHDANNLMVLWRTEVGYLAHAFSRDGGQTFSPPTLMTYDGKRKIKNPRGAITPHRFANGEVLLIFYNNSHTEKDGYVGRRFYWFALGKPNKQRSGPPLLWSEPELAQFYDGEVLDSGDDWNADFAIVDGPGYADFCVIGDESRVAFVESNKLALRFHDVDARTLYFLRYGREIQLEQIIKLGLVSHYKRVSQDGIYNSISMPDFGVNGGGVTIVFSLKASGLVKPKQSLLDTREVVSAALDEDDASNFITKGFCISVDGYGSNGLQLCLSMSDGVNSVKHFTSTQGNPFDRGRHVVSFTIDVAPKIITSTVDGIFCDGGPSVPEGWTRAPKAMGSAYGRSGKFLPTPTVQFPSCGPFAGTIENFLVYDRVLLNAEVDIIGRQLMINGVASL